MIISSLALAWLLQRKNDKKKKSELQEKEIETNGKEITYEDMRDHQNKKL